MSDYSNRFIFVGGVSKSPNLAQHLFLLSLETRCLLRVGNLSSLTALDPTGPQRRRRAQVRSIFRLHFRRRFKVTRKQPASKRRHKYACKSSPICSPLAHSADS